MTDREKLLEQLHKAQVEFASWPQWMRDAARWVSPTMYGGK